MSTDRLGRYLPEGDWRDQREVHRLLAVEAGADPKADVATEDWNYVGRIINAYQRMRESLDKPICPECDKPIDGLVIRCVDCRMPFHEMYCAARHFWPNGRPQSTYPTCGGQPMVPDPGKR